ncbi:glycosyltransferase family 2 protein [Kineococcus gynurae]|uniref:Glycosyltransferase family 2 protein n=1 Tax=Kineococcus gynurae TaxID=452979 RepID=A0ABV5LXC1_9ACTN
MNGEPGSAPRHRVEVQFSVVIATYQAADTLVEQFAALAAQRTTFSFEVLVCDNGSTDGTRDLVAAWTGRLPGLRWVDASARRGAGAARNVGAAEAAGEWLAFCDADDVVDPDWLQALGTALLTAPVVAGRFGMEALNAPWAREARAADQQDGLQNSPFPPYLPHAGAGNMGLHKAAFDAVSGFDPEALYLEDTDLSWRLQLAGYSLVFCAEALVEIRLRASMGRLYRQGYNYGASEAWLQQRYAGVDAHVVEQSVDPVAETSTTSPSGGEPGAVTMLRKLLAIRGRGTFGHFLWQLGWHVGHRRPPYPPPTPLRLSTGEVGAR